MKNAIISAVACVAIGGMWANAQTPVPAAGSSPAVMDQPAFPIQLRALRAVQDLRERPTKWQSAAEEAAGRVKDPGLHDQVNQRLAAVAPIVAQQLLTKPGETAVVTIAIFKDPKTDKQTLAGVSYDGLGDSLNPAFFPRLLADVPSPASAKQQTEGRLELDPIATSYLCFYLDHADLMAGDVPHTIMKKSLDVAIKASREKGAALATNGSAGSATQAQARAQQDLINQRMQDARNEQRRNDDAAQTASANNASYDNAVLPMLPYGYGNFYGGYGGWQPWFAYIPVGGGPVVVTQRDTQPNQDTKDKNNIPQLGPNVPAQRDPKTGQPLPPQLVTGGNGTAAPAANGNTASTNNPPAGGNATQQPANTNGAQQQQQPVEKSAGTSGSAQPSNAPAQGQAPAQREAPARSAPPAPAQRSAPAPARGGGEAPAKK